MNRGESQPIPPNAVDVAVQRELIVLLFGSPSVPLINGLVALVTAAVLWPIFRPWMLLAWLIASLAIVAARLLLWAQFNRRRAQTGSLTAWANQFTLATGATGCLWGLMAVTPFVAAQPIHYVFAAFVVGGLCAGAAMRLSPHPAAFYAYIGTSAPPMAVALFLRGQLIPSAMGALLAAFVTVMILLGRENYQRLADYIRLKIEQEVLNKNLQKVTLDLTEQIAEKERIAMALQRRQSDLTTIAKLSDMLQSCRAVSEAYPVIANMAVALFPHASGSLARLHAEDGELMRVAAWGSDPACSVPAFQQEDCQALRAHQEFESSPDSGPRCRHISPDLARRSLCLPLTVHGQPRGVLTAAFDPDHSFDDATRQALHSFADVVKLSLANLELRESLVEQAIRDPLTGLFNRRYLMETLPREIGRSRRRGVPLTVAMLDIDHFKRFNDVYGHDAGDWILAELAGQFSGALRADDVACRYGGEEFLFLLPGCSPVDACQRMADIARNSKTRTYVFRGKPLPGITFSIGLAALTDGQPTGESLITAADKAMYVAKRMGRDRIECFEASPQDMQPASEAANPEKRV